ncbi:MAG: HAMP domain-containing sensor histidine kinase [Chitinophagales bacterium]
MKLLSLINRRYLVSSVVLLTICCVFLFFMIGYVIHSDMDENMADEQQQIALAFQLNGELPEAQNLKSVRVEVSEIAVAYEMEPRIVDTLIYNTFEDEYIPHRQLSFVISNGHKHYLIRLSHSKLESDDLLVSLLIFTIIFMLALIAVIYFFNRSISKKIWQSFNDTLQKLRAFDLTGKNQISFSHSLIAEFEELNQSLSRMTEKINRDYSRLKEFTENASHEIQTPLSIIRGKLEILIQSDQLDEEQMNSIQAINEAISRLSKLNSALLTLTRIENYQFTGIERIHLATFLRNKLAMLDEMLQQKEISVSLDFDEGSFLIMNPSLVDLLFDNLIGNALKHNHEKGFIRIHIGGNKMSISNSGEPARMSTEILFDRFVKNSPSSESLGLGLAMVRQICMNYGFGIQYIIEGTEHTMILSF